MGFVEDWPELTIGQAAQKAGVATSSIRYYESIGLLPEPDELDPSPIYVVVTDPGVRDNQSAAGFNTRNTGSIFDSDGANEIWSNGDSADSFTKTLSHELAEVFTDNDASGYEVNPGPGWLGSSANAAQIGDYEGGIYAYRTANGVMWCSRTGPWPTRDGWVRTGLPA